MTIEIDVLRLLRVVVWAVIVFPICLIICTVIACMINFCGSLILKGIRIFTNRKAEP